MFLVFDTETTGLPKSWRAPLTDLDNWPRMVQLAWQCHDEKGKFLFAKNHVILPDGYTIPEEVVQVHGITTEIAQEQGIPLSEALLDFVEDVKKAKFIIGHNIEFDVNIVGAELLRCEMKEIMTKAPQLCTKIESTEYCAIMKKGKVKWPTLTELHLKLFGVPFEEAHNAAADVVATTRCFLELIRVGGISGQRLQMTDAEITAFQKVNPKEIKPVGIKFESFKKNEFLDMDLDAESTVPSVQLKPGEKAPFIHLHVHSQYSILDGAIKTADIAKRAKEDGMPAIAITDHGGMFGAKEFHVSCKKAEIKPIIGVEAYVAARGHLRKDDKTDASGRHIILLAKNIKGYRNLIKLTSIAHTTGMYYKPRIDKDLLKQYSEGLIVSSACLGGEVAQHIMNGNFEKAEETILWFKEVFGDDYYLELMRHENNDPVLKRDIWENQQKVNKVLIQLSRKLDVKLIATNDAHFAEAEDAEAHDLLVCLSTGRDFDDPTRMRYTKQEWLKTTTEMNALFADVPEALINTLEIAEKVEAYELDSAPIMPPFAIPEESGTIEQFREKYNEDALIEEFTKEAYERIGGYDKVLQIKLEAEYLKSLTYEGAKKRYGEELEESVVERLEFELDTIKTMGFPGYFLITQDFINWAKDNGVIVGPGRGSAAGSAVAYSIGITNVDPIKYDLLFERFLNPDRVSMPDVDIDFDDDGRQRVLDWVTEKYGKDKVAHICTFGTMATKSSIKDVARVLKLPLEEANRLAKMVPEAPKMNFKKAYKESHELLKERKDSPNELLVKTLINAEKLEGSVRHTGVHACGILISRDPLEDHLPVMPTKGEELLTTQFDGRFVEDIGLLKMDFLGLKTLSIIKETLENIRLSKGVNIDIDKISFEDEKAYNLFSNGETTAIFQFESPGMKKHLQNLKPDRFDDLVAMNALYRPGPMEYIPSFIERKHGREKVEYDHPMMEPFLKDTYGITVYQEQVMLQSRALGGFTRGDSDTLRKAMGKKIIAMMDKLKTKFQDGCNDSEEFVRQAKEKNKDVDKLVDKIWGDWEAFAAYAFNKSHSVCYAYIAYQTGYLKAHFPAEFMAANLSRNLSNIVEVTKLMEECRRMKQMVFGPDVNLSYKKFTVDKNGDIRFGMAAIKNVGEGAVENIINEREANGSYKDIYDFVERVELRSVNRKTFEALAQAGAFDLFHEVEHRSQFFELNDSRETFIESILRYGNLYKNDLNNNQNTLFGAMDEDVEISKPPILQAEPWGNLEKLNRERELVGIYLSSHPLDEYKIEINSFCNGVLADLNDLNKLKGKDFSVGGIVTAVRSGMTKNNKPFGGFTIEDYSGSHELMFFGKDYLEYKNYCTEGYTLFVKGKVQERLWGKEEVKPLEFKVTSIQMLGDLRENLLKSISIKLPIGSIDESLIKDLLAKVEANEGKAILKFLIFDPVKKIWVQMFSRLYRIDVTNDFIDYLENHPVFEYKLD